MLGSKHLEWRRVRLEDVVERVAYRHTPTSGTIERYVGADHVDEGNPRITRWGLTSDSTFPPTFRFRFEANTVLVHSRNIKKIAFADFRAVTGEKFFALAPKNLSELEAHYLLRVIQSETFTRFAEGQLVGSVNKFLNWGALKEYEFVLPPVTDQEQVCKTLNALDFVVESYTSAASSTADLIRSLSVNELEKSGAETLPFSALANIERGVSYKSSDYIEDGVGRPFLTLKSVTRDGRYSPSGIKWVRDSFALKNRVEPGDLFFANTDLTPGRLLVGSPFFLSDEEGLADACFSMDLSRVNATDPRVTNEYIYFALNLPRVRQVMRNLTGGSTVGHLRLSGVSEIEIPVLAESEMRTFICQMRSVKTLQRNLDDHLAKLRIVRSSVLQSLIGGGDHV